MKRYYITYNTKDGDSTNIWVEADSVDEAKNIAYHEYWDIGEITYVGAA